MGEERQHAEEDAAVRRGVVDVLRHRDERDAGPAEDVERLDGDAHIAGEAVDLVDDDHIEPAGAHVVQQVPELNRPDVRRGSGSWEAAAGGAAARSS